MKPRTQEAKPQTGLRQSRGGSRSASSWPQVQIRPGSHVSAAQKNHQPLGGITVTARTTRVCFVEKTCRVVYVCPVSLPKGNWPCLELLTGVSLNWIFM
ncbi:hypothetical protein NL676_036759 [Syzygium grande]|nr:hypothetical protein NL676_036759 [Syzygium grande]